MEFLELQALTDKPPKLHALNGGLISHWRIDNTTCFELNRHLKTGMKTVETGAGLSTIIFAANGCDHTCIVPDHPLVDRIKAHCHENGISTDTIEFIMARSTDAVYNLTSGYELALIDGTHGFPAALIDFYYATNALKIGGTLIIDDMHIYTCHQIASFMKEDAGWDLEMFTHRVAIGTKVADTIDTEWNLQPFVCRRSAGPLTSTIRAATSSLQRDGITPTMRKIAKRVLPG